MHSEDCPRSNGEVYCAPNFISSNNRPACFNSTTRECLFVLSVTLAACQEAIYPGALIGILTLISRDLSMSPTATTWLSAAPSLTGGAFLLMFARLADLYGRKRVLLTCTTCFTLSILAASFAPSAIWMDTFSSLVGIFSAGVSPAAVGMLGAIYDQPSPRKNRAFACFSTSSLVGYIGGMVISGVATNTSTWRTSFRAIAVLCTIFTCLSVFAIPSDRRTEPLLASRALYQFDIGGVLAVVIGFSCLSSGLSLAGDAPNGWRTGYIISLLLVATVSFVGLFWWESRARNPIMPLYIWRDRTFTLLMIILCLGYMSFTSTFFWISLLLQNVHKSSAIQIAGELLPSVIAGLATNAACGLLLDRVNNRLLMGVSVVCYTTSFILLSYMREGSAYWAFIFPSLIMMGTAVGVQYNVVNMYVVSSFPSDHQSVAAGIFSTATKLCTTLGLSVSTAIYLSVVHRMEADKTALKPYLSVFLSATALAGTSLLLVPFLGIRTQGTRCGLSESTLNKATDTVDA